MVQSRYDQIELCDEFLNNTRLFTFASGDGTSNSSGVLNTATEDAMNGVFRLNPGTTNGGSSVLLTNRQFQPEAQYLIDFEAMCAVQDISTTHFFLGLSTDDTSDVAPTTIATATATALTPALSDYVGILWNSVWTDGHLRYVWRGGTGAAQGTALTQETSSVDADEYASDLAIADGSWFTARVRVNQNGDAEFWVEGRRVKKDGRGDEEDENVRNYWRVPGAVDPTERFALNILAENRGTQTNDTKRVYIDYANLAFRRGLK